MAQADGTIIIDTEIDSDGAKKGSKELESQIRNLASTVDGVGAKAKNALNKQIDAFAKLNNEYAAQEKKVSELRQKVEEFAKQRIPTDEYKNLQSELEKSVSKLEKLEEMQKKYIETSGDYSDSNAFKRRQYDIETLTRDAEQLKNKMQDLEKSGKGYQKVPTDEYKEMQAQLEKTTVKLNNLQDKRDKFLATGGRKSKIGRAHV